MQKDWTDIYDCPGFINYNNKFQEDCYKKMEKGFIEFNYESIYESYIKQCKEAIKYEKSNIYDCPGFTNFFTKIIDDLKKELGEGCFTEFNHKAVYEAYVKKCQMAIDFDNYRQKSILEIEDYKQKLLKDKDLDRNNEVSKIKLSKKEKLIAYIIAAIVIFFFFAYKHF